MILLYGTDKSLIEINEIIYHKKTNRVSFYDYENDIIVFNDISYPEYLCIISDILKNNNVCDMTRYKNKYISISNGYDDKDEVELFLWGEDDGNNDYYSLEHSLQEYLKNHN